MTRAGHHTMMLDEKLPYLQANGLAWIDTGVPVTTNCIIRGKFQLLDTGGTDVSPAGFWFRTTGGSETSMRVYWRNASSDYRAQAGATNAVTFSPIPEKTAVHEFEVRNGRAALDDQILSTTQKSETNSGWTQHLFGVYNKNPVAAQDGHAMQNESTIIRIWWAQWLDENENLIRDFIPKSVGGSNGMFDRVTQTFFGKAAESTGEFLIGYKLSTGGG